jgi:hypothetical protein
MQLDRIRICTYLHRICNLHRAFLPKYCQLHRVPGAANPLSADEVLGIRTAVESTFLKLRNLYNDVSALWIHAAVGGCRGS